MTRGCWIVFVLLALLYYFNTVTHCAKQTVTYDGRSLIINGQRQLIISGAVHYPRAYPSKWPTIIKRAKEAGLNTIETYVFWNLHDKLHDGVHYDFSEHRDLRRFIALCEAEGLYVILRIGPYVCAEWNYGGFPAWLKNISGIKFRTDNEPFKREMGNWMKYLVDYLKDKFENGPIILTQVENEYGNVESHYGKPGHAYAEWSINFAQNLNVSVPWMMCQQDDIPEALNTCNGFYCDNWIAEHKSRYPNKPAFWTENWPGWFQNWGQPFPTRPAEDIAFSVARWYARGGSLMNYYMFFGGTNFGRTAGGPFITTSYDYDAPLDEYAQPNQPKYTHLQKLHQVLQVYNETILSQDPPKPIPLGPQQEAHVYGKGNARIVFLSNIDSKQPATVTFEGTKYYLPPWSVSILGGNTKRLLYNSANTGDISYTKKEPAVVHKDFSFTHYMEPLPLTPNNTQEYVTAKLPIEHLKLSNDTTDYVWYVRNITVTKSGTYSLTVELLGDVMHVFFNDKLIESNIKGKRTFSVEMKANKVYTLKMLCVTMGLINYGVDFESYARGISKLYLKDKDITKGDWLMQVATQGEVKKIYNNTDAVVWGAGVPVSTPLIWYRSEFKLKAEPGVQYALDLRGLNKGNIYMNSFHLGRYVMDNAKGDCKQCNYAGPFDPSNCLTRCNEPSQIFFHFPTEWLRENYNFIVIFEELGGDPTNISFVKF